MTAKSMSCFLLLALISFSGRTAYSSGLTDVDINGWSKAKWGMTKDQLLQRLDNALEMEKKASTTANGFYEVVRVPEIEIDGVEFQPALYMSDKDDKLHMVQLFNKLAIEPDFTRIKALYVKKYGQPKVDEKSRMSSGDYQLSVKWFLPSTTIELVYMTMNFMHKSFISIRYTDAHYNAGDMDQI